MKNFTLILLIALTIFGCSDEIEFNSPSFQGDRNYELWKAEAYTASIGNSGLLIISASNASGTVNLIVPSVSESTFIVGDENVSIAEYIDSFGTQFSTNNLPDESVSIYPELGEIVIEEIDVANATFSGTFRFLAFDASGLNSVGYNNGVFDKVPLISGTLN